MKQIYIFDFDNILTNGEKFPKDWTPNEDMLSLARMFANAGGEIWVWSNRSEKIEQKILLFLTKHAIPVVDLRLRPAWDNSLPEHLIERFLQEIPGNELDAIKFVFAECSDCAKVYNDAGLKVLQIWN